MTSTSTDKRQYEFLNLYLYKGTNSRIKATNKDTLALAETIRANLQTELQYSEHDIIPRFKRNADFVEYFKKVGESKGRSSLIWKSTLKHLEEFTGGQVAFKIINERWLEKWQNFLLEKVSRNTAAGHYAKNCLGYETCCSRQNNSEKPLRQYSKYQT